MPFSDQVRKNFYSQRTEKNPLHVPRTEYTLFRIYTFCGENKEEEVRMHKHILERYFSTPVANSPVQIEPVYFIAKCSSFVAIYHYVRTYVRVRT